MKMDSTWRQRAEKNVFQRFCYLFSINIYENILILRHLMSAYAAFVWRGAANNFSIANAKNGVSALHAIARREMQRQMKKKLRKLKT